VPIGCPNCKSTNIVSTQMAVISGTSTSSGTGIVQGNGFNSEGNSVHYTGSLRVNLIEQSGLARLAAPPNTELIQQARDKGNSRLIGAIVSVCIVAASLSMRKEFIPYVGVRFWALTTLFFITIGIILFINGIIWFNHANSPKLQSAARHAEQERLVWEQSFVCQACGTVFEKSKAIQIAAGGISKAEELEKLAQLWKSGALTESEFQMEKSKLLTDLTR